MIKYPLIFLLLIPFFNLKAQDDSIERPRQLMQEKLPFSRGERLRYVIHYGPVNAGEAVFRVRDTLVNLRNRKHYLLSVSGRSFKAWDMVYKIRDYYYSFIDTATLLPTVAVRDVQEGKYETKEKLVFHHDKGYLTSNGKRHDVPQEIYDILSAIYFGRSIDFTNMEPETEIPINSFFSDSLFPVGATYKGIGEVKTKLGRFKCYIIKPHLVEGRIFKGQDDMTLYVTADKNQIPVRIESAIFVGYIQADLRNFEGLKFPLDSRLE